MLMYEVDGLSCLNCPRTKCKEIRMAQGLGELTAMEYKFYCVERGLKQSERYEDCDPKATGDAMEVEHLVTDLKHYIMQRAMLMKQHKHIHPKPDNYFGRLESTTIMINHTVDILAIKTKSSIYDDFKIID